jgi:purine-binding chemotaxis protein CheW
MQNLYLIAIVAGQRVAINAADVESVVRTGVLIPVPKTSPAVAGLFAMRSRVLTMIDCVYSATGISKCDICGSPAIVICEGAHYFGLLVDKVLEVVDASVFTKQPAPRLTTGWATIVTGLLELDDGPVMVLDTKSIIACNPIAQAA